MSDGRNAGLRNGGFGTVFGIADGRPLPVCDYAGFLRPSASATGAALASVTIQVFEDFLPRKVWRDKITFHKLNLPNSGRIPIGPNAVIDDDIGFNRSI